MSVRRLKCGASGFIFTLTEIALFPFPTALALSVQPSQGLYPSPAAVGPRFSTERRPSSPSPLGVHHGSQFLHEEPPSLYFSEPPAAGIPKLLPVPE